MPGADLMFNSQTRDGIAIGKLEGDPRFHASLSRSACLALLDAAGLDLLAWQVAAPDCGGRTVWLFANRRA